MQQRLPPRGPQEERERNYQELLAELTEKFDILTGIQNDVAVIKDCIEKKAENSYIELSSVYKWKTVECTEQGRIKTIEEIGDEVLQIVLDQIKNA